MRILRRVSTTATPSGPAGGELTGTYPNPTVVSSHSGSAHHAQLHASAHTTGADKVATGTPDGTKFLRDDFAWAAPTATAAAHAANHQADGSDSLYIEMSPDSNVTVPTDYGFVVVGPYALAAGVTLTLQGTARMVVL